MACEESPITPLALILVAELCPASTRRKSGERRSRDGTSRRNGIDDVFQVGQIITKVNLATDMRKAFFATSRPF